ncbi:MAG: sensor histidine kinase [Deltaproteobacteria bacterium]|nr:sensor histidine kinase [Deltaproteobacteria bacterium]
MTPEEQWLWQKERVLAWVRFGFSLAALLVIQLNPQRLASFPLLSHISLFSFFIYSLLIVILIRRDRLDSQKIGLLTTCLDLLWISLIVLSTGGSRTPFFAFYLFPVITGGSRYGIKGGLIVALLGVASYGFIRFSIVHANPLGIDTFIIRSIYLLVLAYIFGFISEFERKQNQKLMALYKTANEVATHQERRRIARELHDRLLQVLASLTVRLETCRRHLIKSPEELSRELELMERASRSSMEEIRRFLAGKDGQDFTPGTLTEKLREEMHFLRDGLGLRAVLESDPENLTLPSRVEEEIYYVLREGLRNIARHSHASMAQILLTELKGEIHGSLKDDGVGFDVSAARNGDGFGLVAMDERIQKLGGRLAIQEKVHRRNTDTIRSCHLLFRYRRYLEGS